jgi:thiol-disulfide isomerase/thioredoxin
MSRLALAVGLGALCLSSIPACAEEPKAPLDPPAAAKTEADGTAKKDDAAKAPEAAADPFKVPDGTAEELLAYIEGLKDARPQGDARQDFLDFQKKLAGAIAGASEKVVLGEASEEQAAAALQYLTQAIAILGRLGDDDATTRLADVRQRLITAGKPALARQLQSALLAGKLQKSAGKPADVLRPVLAEVKAHLAEETSPRDLRLAMTAVQVSQYSDDEQLALSTAEDMANALRAAKDEEVQEFAKRLDGVVRRLKLLGNEMKIEGQLLSGGEFDWSKYRGKVVLVDFWATWCGPCRASIPHLKKLYEQYHEKGFEIVAPSLDRSSEPLVEYVKEQEIRWPIIFNGEEPSPTADYYGVMAIPTTILVGSDGRVIAMNPSKADLEQKLESLLGPPAEKTDEKADDKPADKPDEAKAAM